MNLYTSARTYIGIAAFLYISVLAISGCTTTQAHHKPAMPPCIVNGERGVWVSTNKGESYRCVHRAEFENWWKWVNQ